MHLTGS